MKMKILYKKNILHYMITTRYNKCIVQINITHLQEHKNILIIHYTYQTKI